MLDAIKTLGKYEIAKEDLDPVDQFIEEAKLKNTKKVICIVFRRGTKNILYNLTHIEDYDSLKPRNYLYRSHQSKQFDITPTTKIAYDSEGGKPKIKEAFDRIQQWFKKFIPLLEKNQKNNADYFKQVKFLKQIRDEVSKNKEKIVKDISGKYEKLKTDKNPKENEKRNCILTIKVKEDGKEKYIGDFDIFKKILKEEGLRLLSYRHNVEIKGEGICALCGNRKEVCDYFPLKIYSVDKRGFAPEFIRKNAWKRLPICTDCVPYLMVGGEFLNKYLRKNFYGYNFYVIPHFILGEPKEDAIGVVIKEIKRQRERREYKGLLIEGDDILELLKEKEDILNLIFMFCEFGQSIKILKYVEDVPPSWIKRLYNTLEKINYLSIFKEESLKKMGIIGKKESGDLEDIYHAETRIGGLVKRFFPSSKFIDVSGDILAQKPINKNLLMDAFIREIRNEHAKGEDKRERVLALESLILLLFLNELNLVKGGNMEESESIEKQRIKLKNVEEFLASYKQAFDAPAKKAVFFEGVLVKFLLDVQYATRESTPPFRAKLHGLKLNEKRIKKLLPEIIEKLREYKAGYPWLEELVSKYLIEADNNGWSLSGDEVSYYFALGLNLGRIFKEQK